MGISEHYFFPSKYGPGKPKQEPSDDRGKHPEKTILGLRSALL